MALFFVSQQSTSKWCLYDALVKDASIVVVVVVVEIRWRRFAFAMYNT
jgi:hypothetical protein